MLLNSKRKISFKSYVKMLLITFVQIVLKFN